MLLLLSSSGEVITIVITQTLPRVEQTATILVMPLEWLVDAGGGWSVSDSGVWPGDSGSNWGTSQGSSWPVSSDSDWEVR